MKYRLLLLPLLPTFFLMVPKAEAQSLLANSCVSENLNPSYAIQADINGTEVLAYLVEGVNPVPSTNRNLLGLTCKDIRAIDQAAYVVGVAVAPAVSSLMAPAVRSVLAAELASLGIVVGSPALVTATVIGSFGVITYNVLMRISLEKCAEQDREALKNELLREFELRYGLQSNQQTSFQIIL